MIVGIIGCSGGIGKGIAEYLLGKKYTVYGVQRHRTDDLSEHENFRQMIFDISDTEKLTELASECDMLINCVAPAYVYSNNIAVTAGKKDCIYLDLTDCIAADELPEGGTYITSCGYIPGLSAMIPKLIIEKHFDKAERAVLFQGGTELCSDRALADIIMSSEKSGYIDSYYRDGDIKKLIIDPRKRFELPLLGNEVFLKPYLSDEMAGFAKDTGISSLKWFNAYENISQFMFFIRLIGAVSSGDVEKLSAMTAAERDKRSSSGRALYSAMLGDIIGMKDGAEKCVRFILSFSDMNKICSLSAGITAEMILTSDLGPGLYLGYQFADPEIISEIQERLCDSCELGISEVPVNSSFEDLFS